MKQVCYADTSVLVKRHIEEIGSTWFRNLAMSDTTDQIVSTELSIVEVFSAFNRRKRESTISQTDYDDFATNFRAIVINEYLLIELSDPIITESQRLLESHPLHAGDAIQLATAINARNTLHKSLLPAPIFLTSDNKLLDAAIAEGFTTDNPLQHP